MHVVAEEPCAWQLLADDERLFLSVVCGTVALFVVTVELDESERARYRASGLAAIRELDRAITSSPRTFQPRHLATFEGWPGVAAAIQAWRAAPTAKPG